MALTAEQRTARRQYIGSSEAAAILGLDPYRSASDIWLEKTGQLAEWDGNEATERGRLLEPVLLDWAEGELRKEFSRDVMITHRNGMLCTNFDAIVAIHDGDIRESVEAKTTVIEEGWGEPGTDEVPDRVIAQAHHGFACLPSLKTCWVPVLLPTYRKFDFRLYRIERNEKLVEAVELACTGFMERHVRLGIPPDDFRPSLEVLKRVRREPGKPVEIHRATLEKYIVLNAAVDHVTEERDAAKAALLAEMGDGDAASIGGEIVATYLETNRREHVVKASTYRQLRIKKAKGAVSE